MAAAVVMGVQTLTPDHKNVRHDVVIYCAFAGPDVPHGAHVRQVHLDLVDGDSAVVTRVKLTDAVVREAVSLGFTVARQAVMLPDLQRGA